MRYGSSELFIIDTNNFLFIMKNIEHIILTDNNLNQHEH